eukprot:15334797-Ditylum_brightwellii.AAC.1
MVGHISWRQWGTVGIAAILGPCGKVVEDSSAGTRVFRRYCLLKDSEEECRWEHCPEPYMVKGLYCGFYRNLSLSYNFRINLDSTLPSEMPEAGAPYAGFEMITVHNHQGHFFLHHA